MNAPRAPIPPDTLALYEKLVATIPDIERKGASVPYTSLNGHMFSMITSRATVALRLSPADRDAFMTKFMTPPLMQYGVLMKEYVEVPPALLKQTCELARYFDLSLRYVASLKPKPTTRAKSKSSPPKKAQATLKKPAPRKPRRSNAPPTKAAKKPR